MMLRPWVFLPVLGLAGLFSAACHAPPATAHSQESEALSSRRPAPISLFITTRLENTTEPCGCNSEPLGDVARIAALLRSAGDRGLLLDAGGLRYKPLRPPPERQRQARLTADFLETSWHKLGATVMLQPSDLNGADGVRELDGRMRLISNVAFQSGSAPIALETEAIRKIAGVTLGILGLADPNGAWPPEFAGKVSDPVPAAQRGVLRLREKGAQAVIALSGLSRQGARRLAQRVPGIDLVVAGGDPELTDGVDVPEQIGSTVLIVPAIWGQRLFRVELYPHEGAPGTAAAPPRFALQLTAEQKERALQSRRQQLARLTERLLELRKDAAAEPEFIHTTQKEIERLTAEIAQAESRAFPPHAGYVTAELVPIRQKLPRDRETADQMSDLDRRIAAANLQAQSGPPPKLPAGQPSFVGVSGCQGACHFHDDAVSFWQKTHHAQAFPTLVAVGKALSYECVSCHAVGFDEPGGSNLWTLHAWQGPRETASADARPPAVPDLRNVQCETCHGPGSLHVRAPSKNPIPIARPTEERCLTCHNKLHSDTFDFMPYLRDILGPGHGAERRAALGDGPTGHALRSAALKKQATLP